MAPKKNVKQGGKKRAPAPAPMPATSVSPAEPVKEVKKAIVKPHLFEKRVRSFRIGGDIQPKRDLSRFLRWPKYINLQRKKRILLTRLKVPPMINQFSMAANKNQASLALKLAKKYAPESEEQKKQRLARAAKQIESGENVTNKKPLCVKFGVNEVVSAVEKKQAKLVLIAHDVDPIEIVLCLPTICRKMGVPYMIVKGKAQLGQVVGNKTCACVAFTGVKGEDQNDLESVRTSALTLFNNNTDMRRRWGGGIMGIKSQHVMKKREAAIAAEQAKKLGLQM